MFVLTGLLFACAAFVGWAANNVNHGYVWTDQFCRGGAVLCENPKYMLFVAIGAGLIAIYRHALR